MIQIMSDRRFKPTMISVALALFLAVIAYRCFMQDVDAKVFWLDGSLTPAHAVGWNVLGIAWMFACAGIIDALGWKSRSDGLSGAFVFLIMVIGALISFAMVIASL